MFDLEKTVEKRFGSFDEALAFVSEEKKRIVRIPIFSMWKEGARFYEDGRFGKGSKFFKFSPYGFQAICNMTGVSGQTLTRLQTSELASKVLNDLMEGVLNANRTAKSAEIILDEDKGAVIGVVSEKYVGYSNDAFLRDVLICLDEDNNGALFPTSGKDYGAPLKYSQKHIGVYGSFPRRRGGHEALRVFRSRLRDNASMYDFVNIFTEHAKDMPDGQKIDVETKAGSLASWIAENKRKFA